MSDNYLRVYLEQFEQVSKDRYGWPFDLKAIEDGVRHLRSKKKISRVYLLDARMQGQCSVLPLI